MIKFISKEYNASTILEESIVPSIGSAINVQNTSVITLSDYEGLFLGFGRRETCYPYREINMYTEAAPSKVRVAILENDYLYAEFLVDFGGRLWALKNKKTGEDLLYTNDVIRIRNLSLRNGWFSGGVEWNIGVVGHTAYTCDPLYTAKVTGKNGEEVLRFYEFERVREVYYQIDFWLDADKLMTRVRIENPSKEVVPMYWWSNIASPEYKGGRLVVDAESAFSNSGSKGIGKATIPVVEDGTDVSFYEDIPSIIDYFFDIKNRSEKFISNLDGNGRGLLQCSSSRQQGRKLFSWGHNSGGKHWQDVLTDNAGYYIEIQAGLGKTQYGCVPMAPNTSYEWVEVYTSIAVDKNIVTGDYKNLVGEVKSQLFSEKIDTETLDEVCDITRDSIALVAGEVIYKGSGFGYVKDCVEHTMPKHLHFEICDKSKKYFDLVTSGEYDSDI